MINTANRVPFLDLVTPHQKLKNELRAVLDTALRTGEFIGGPIVEEFEREFADFCDVPHCVGVGSGTDALRFALMAAGVRAGDIVITVPNTFIATTEAISQAGAHPVFVDIDERTYNMDVDKLGEYLQQKCSQGADGRLTDRASGQRVAAVVPVHLYGQMCDMDGILELAGLYNVTVIEDACQAHGAEYFSRKENRWRKAGSMGRAAAFSFYPGKNLGACGEAGAVTTSDPDVAQRVRMLRDHGQTRKYYHDVEGYNGRLDAVQAGVLRVKLRHLAAWNAERRQCAEGYAELLDGQGIRGPFEPSWSKSVYHLYVIRTRGRDELQKHLTNANIGTGIHYPIPLHMQKAYGGRGYAEGQYPIAERAATEILSLPMFSGLTAHQQCRVVGEIAEFGTTTAKTLAACAGR